MKIFKMVGMALLAVSLCVSLNSCKKEITEDLSIPDEVKTYEILLNLGGEQQNI